MPSRYSRTPSEGEVNSSDSEKAHKQSTRYSANIDRRTRDYASASRSRSRSPYRAQRGEKRRHDRSRERQRHDPRQFKVRYDEGHDSGRRHRRDGSHDDIDSGRTAPSSLRYDDDSYRRSRNKRQRTASRSRSRSPYRAGKEKKHSRQPSGQDRSIYKENGHGSGSRFRGSAGDSKSHREQLVSERSKYPGVAPASKPDTELRDSQANDQTVHTGRTADATSNAADAGPETSASLEAEPLDEAAEIEARRRRREAIRARHRSQPQPLLVQALQQNTEAASPAPSTIAPRATSMDPSSPAPLSPQTPKDLSAPPSPAAFDFSNEENLANQGSPKTSGAEGEPSAADYDPTDDMREERARHDQSMFHEDKQSLAVDVARINGESKEVTEEPQAPPKKAKDEFDMFADDDDLGDEDDMFAPISSRKPVDKGPAQALDVNMMDNWDDSEGYYVTIAGELFAGRYAVMHTLGRGMFASVIRAKDTHTDQLVAIKIIRNNDTMRKAGLKEISILETLMAADPSDTKHLVRMLTSFDHKGHLCLVFENLDLNLRELLKKFGRDVGLNLKAIRSYSQQLFLSLSLLKKCEIMHADLKPDNVLCSENHSQLKMCDLGSASPVTENEIAPYLVSRFYRAPEIMLGMDYDCGIDVWSLGCTLFELYTGKILFTGRNNNGMIRAIIECRGPFPNKLLRKGSLTFDHFDDLLNFYSTEQDKLTGRVTTKMLNIKKPIRDLRSRVIPKGKKMDETEKKEVELFLDLLDKCLDLRPEKRITPGEALRHPFLVRGVPAMAPAGAR